MGQGATNIVGVHVGSKLLTGVPTTVIPLGVKLGSEGVMVIHKGHRSTPVGLLIRGRCSQIKLALSLNQTCDSIAKGKIKGSGSILDSVGPSVQVTGSANPFADRKHLIPNTRPTSTVLKIPKKIFGNIIREVFDRV